MSARPLRALALLCLLVACAVATAPADAKPRRAPDQAAKAKALTGALMRAKTLPAREQALKAVFRALRVGVYTGKGKAVVRGAERRDTDPFLYTLELRGLAAAVRGGPLLDGNALAARMATLGVKRRDGRPLTGADLSGPLARAVRRARAKRRTRGALATLLIAELARRAKRPLTGERARFDPLQTWLIGAELLARGRARASVASAAGVPAQAAQETRPCTPGQGRWKKVVDGIDVLGGEVADFLENVGNLGAGPLHGLGLAGMIDFQPAADGQNHRSHYAPARHEHAFAATPGDPLVFRVGVQMLVEPPEPLIRCGPLAGLRVPKKGPIPDIPINWDGIIATGVRTLESHGTIARKDEKTGKDGIATLMVSPHWELVPGVGEERTVADVLQPEAEVFTGLGSKFGNFNEVVNGFFTTFGFSIDFHVARGYRFWSQTSEICTFVDVCGNHSQRNTYTYEARVCGRTPYDVGWTGTRHRRSYSIEGDSDEDTEPIEFTLRKDTLGTVFRPPPHISIDNRVDLKLHEGPPAQMQVDHYHSNNFTPGSELFRKFEDHKLVRVEEDASCPPIPPFAHQVAP